MDHESIPKFTEYEIRVLQLQIACKLEIKERTVEFHLSQILKGWTFFAYCRSTESRKIGLLDDS